MNPLSGWMQHDLYCNFKTTALLQNLKVLVYRSNCMLWKSDENINPRGLSQVTTPGSSPLLTLGPKGDETLAVGSN